MISITHIFVIIFSQAPTGRKTQCVTRRAFG